MEQICKKERRRKSFSSCRGSHLLSFFSRSASAAHLNSLCSSSSLGICEAIRAEKERCHQDDHLPTTLRRPLDSSNWITVAQLYTKTLESFPKFPIRSCWQPNIYFFHSRAWGWSWIRWRRKLPIRAGRPADMSAWLADSCVNFNLALCRQERDGYRRRLQEAYVLLLVHLPPNKVSIRQITSFWW